MEQKKVTADVFVDTKKSFRKIHKLIRLLKKANSLADELAADLKKLKMNIKI